MRSPHLKDYDHINVHCFNKEGLDDIVKTRKSDQHLRTYVKIRGKIGRIFLQQRNLG